jgi:hypothetical protein
MLDIYYVLCSCTHMFGFEFWRAPLSLAAGGWGGGGGGGKNNCGEGDRLGGGGGGDWELAGGRLSDGERKVL